MFFVSFFICLPRDVPLNGCALQDTRMRPSRDVPLDKTEKQSKDQHKFTCVTWWQIHIMNIVGFKVDVAGLSGGEGEVPQVVGD